MKETCAHSHATNILYVLLTDCALRLVLRAGLRLAPSLATSALYRAKAAGRGLIHALRAATACLGCGVQGAALLHGAHCDRTALLGGAVLHAGYLALAVDGLLGDHLGRRRGVVAAAAIGLVAVFVHRLSVAKYALYWAFFCFVKQTLQMLLWRSRGWRAPPWPTTLPLLGNIMPAAPAFMRFLLRQAKRHFAKEGLFLFWPLGGAPLCVVAHAAAARKVLSDRSVFPKGPDYRKKFGFVFGDGLVTSEGASHMRARKLLAPFFRSDRLQTQQAQVARAFADSLSELGEGDVDLQGFFHLATLRAFCSCLLTEDVDEWNRGNDEKGETARFIAEACSFGSLVVGEHMLFDLPMSETLFGRVRKLRRMRDDLRSKVLGPVVERRRRMRDPPDDCLTALVRHQMLDRSFTDADVLDQLVTLIGAGHDTSAYFLCYACFELARYPIIQEDLRRELRTDTEDLCRRVVRETLRLYPVIPMVTRVAAVSTSLVDGRGNVKHVPRGARCVVPFFLLNRLPEVWGADAAEFRPDRFLEVRGAVAAPAQGFLPFGSGARTCVGQALALLEAKVFLRKLLDAYDLKEVPGFAPVIKAGVSLTAAGGVRVRLAKR